MAAFMRHCADKREAIKETISGASFAEIGKALAEAWRDLIPDDRVLFQATLARQEKRGRSRPKKGKK
jgi:hypothetical protein